MSIIKKSSTKLADQLPDIVGPTNQKIKALKHDMTIG